MKQFHTIAVPHADILEGRLTMDIFAADLWEVYNKRGPAEYKDAELFFKKTFLTKGLDTLMKVVEKRIRGKGGDSVIQLQTPFGGGKTHALIALYHKAREWKANMFVFVGDKLSPTDTIIWEEMERQLTGQVKELKGNVVPSGEKIRKVLESKSPVILLFDELIEYLIPSRAMEIGKTTFDSQVLAFIKRLSEVVSSIDKAIMLVTSPSRTHYSPDDQNLLNLLSERLGRIEKSFTPVEEEEISSIIRKRLFSNINEEESKKIVAETMDYFKNENILPQGIEPTEYKAKFMNSYPFLPDVVECFYHRWGSFPTFQRTRGVLRLLSLVLYSLKAENISYISLADIDLKNTELRRELLKHIGNEFDGIISADITDKNSGSKQVDKSLGDAFKGLQIGTRSSTTVFLYSFSGGTKKGTSVMDVKRAASLISIPSTVVSEAVDLLKDKLFYIQHQAGMMYFANQPNLNRVLLTKMENIDLREITEIEKDYLINFTKKSQFKTYIWSQQSNDIIDDTSLKLVILKSQDKSAMKDIVENKGNSKRVNRNTIFFLSPIESKKQELESSIKRKIAFEELQTDSSINLNEEQKREIRNSLKKEEDNVQSKIREIYRLIYVPSKNKMDEIDLGIQTYGFQISLAEEVFEKLKSEGTIIEKIGPLALKERYLKGKKHVSTKLIYENALKTLGEDRICSQDVLENCIKEGVRQGVYGLGELKDNKLIPVYWKKEPEVSFVENEVLIDATICQKELEPKFAEKEAEQQTAETQVKLDISTKENAILGLELPTIKIPKGRVSQVMGLLNYIQTKFNIVELKISASEGSIKKDEYENKVKEALKQIGVDID